MKSAIVALYTADPQGILRYSDCVGLLQLDIDRHYKSKFLRLYDLDTLGLALEVEIYYGFQKSYRNLTDTLYIFDYPKGSIAFEFRNKLEADIMKMKIDSQCPSLEEYEKIKQRNIEEAKKREEKGGFFNRIKNFFAGDSDNEEQQESEVINFKKNTSIQFDLATGTFNAENVPPEWQEMFDQLGLDKNDLENKEVMGVIVEETILARAKKQAEQENNRALSKQVKDAQNEITQENASWKEEARRNTRLNLPPPPPPPPPPLLGPPQARQSSTGNRANLLEEIRNNNLKLNHVEVNANNQVNLDLADMNREERSDHIDNIRKKLQMRKRALNRRNSDDEDED